MKAIFKYNDKTIMDGQIENVSLLIKLGEEFECVDDNEGYVIKLLKDGSNIFDLDCFDIDCPYEDLVYLSNESFTGKGESGVYPLSKKELDLLIGSYSEALKVFDEEKVRIAVYSSYLFDNINEEDFSLKEFLNNFKLNK